MTRLVSELKDEGTEVKELVVFWQKFISVFHALGYMNDEYVKGVTSQEYLDNVLSITDAEMLKSVFNSMDKTLYDCMVQVSRGKTALCRRQIIDIINSKEEFRDVVRELITLWSAKG